MKRFEVPGWLLIALMTACLGVAVWTVWEAGVFADEPDPPETVRKIEITAAGVAFDKDRLEVKAGVRTRLEFNNDDTVPHVFRADEFSIHLLVMEKQNATMSFIAEDIGTFDFRCDLHPRIMTGTIMVEE